MYAQVVKGIVNLVGGSEVGLPLPTEYLAEHPEVLNIKLSGSETVEPGYYYDKEKGIFTEDDPYIHTNLRAVPIEKEDTLLLALAELYEEIQSMKEAVQC